MANVPLSLSWQKAASHLSNSYEDLSIKMSRMIHRHLNILEGEWSVAVIESIWERGADRDVIALLRTLRKEPFGAAAQAVQKALPHSKVYGYPTLFRIALERWRARKDN